MFISVYLTHFLLIVGEGVSCSWDASGNLLPVCWQCFEDFSQCRTKNRNWIRCGKDPFGKKIKVHVKELKIQGNREGILYFVHLIVLRMTQLVAIFHYDGLLCVFCVGGVSRFTSLLSKPVTCFPALDCGVRLRVCVCVCIESLHAVEDRLRLALTGCFSLFFLSLWALSLLCAICQCLCTTKLLSFSRSRP